MGSHGSANQSGGSGGGSGDPSQGSEAQQKGGKQPAKDHAEKDFEDSPKEDGE